MFLETICIKNGVVQNLDAHIIRMEQTAACFGFPAPILPCLKSMLPKSLSYTNVKCKIEYEKSIQNIEFMAYTPKLICSLRLVEANDINYSFKFSNRSELNALNNEKEECDEVLIIQNGCITDTTYSNVVFQKNNKFFTPKTYLLNGTKRQKLLRKSIIHEAGITVDNLYEFEHVHLINSMLDIEDGIKCPVLNIFSV
ncbi:MAG: aminotransferase class IV [Bacteroidia bacterium]|nr:aminotransferase class IV [Bacteroidia bacterium]